MKNRTGDAESSSEKLCNEGEQQNEVGRLGVKEGFLLLLLWLTSFSKIQKEEEIA